MKITLCSFYKSLIAALLLLVSIAGWGQTATITITNSSIGGSGILGANNYNSGAERLWTQNSIGFGGKAITCNQSNTPTGSSACQYIQAQASNGVIYNTTALPGRLISVKFIGTANVSSSLYGGTSRLVNNTIANYTVTGTQIGTAQSTSTNTYTWTTAATDNYTFFAIKRGTSTQYFSSIVITYETTPPSSYTLTYNGNGNTGGTAPVDTNSPYAVGANVTVLGNTGTLTKDCATFNGWNTQSNGSGTSYAPGATFTINANTTLYAHWVSTLKTVTFNNNEGTGTMAAQTACVSTALTTNSFTRAGYAFAGWNTAANGSGTAYANGANCNFAADITLYAQWTPNNNTITFDKNAADATGTTATQTLDTGAIANLNANGYTRTGYTFAGWATSASGSVVYADQASYTMGTANVTLYAKWTANSYQVIFNKNDASATGTMANQTIPYQTTANLTSNAFTKTGYVFKVWNTATDGSGTSYSNSASFTMNTLGNVTLYAQWEVYVGPCHIEDFSGICTSSCSPSNSSYGARTWTGVGGSWSATNARTDQTITTGNNAITIRYVSPNNGSITSPQFNDGISSITMTTNLPFSDSNGNLTVRINGDIVGTIPYSNVKQTSTISNINIAGNVEITIEETNGARVTIDDISWTCFSGTPQPNISIQGNSTTILDGDNTPSTADGTDFGSTIIAGTSVEKTFTLQNNGSSSLTLDNPAIVLLSGTKGFTVSAQPATNPMTGYTNQTFKINFTNNTPGTYTETVMIGSNDPDTPVYHFDVKAVVLTPTITSDQASITGFTYAFGQGPSARQSFIVNGSNLASDITVSASANWEISTNQTYDGANVSPWNSITLAKTLGNAVNNNKIYVRLKSGLAIGTYTGTITLSSTSATPVVISLNGTVTAGIADIGVSGLGTNIPKNSTSPTGLNNTLFEGRNIGNSQTKTFVISNRGGAPLTIGNIGISGADVAAFTIMSGPVAGTVLNQNETASFDIRFAPTTIGTKQATVTINSDDPDDNPYPFMIQGGATYCSSLDQTEVVQQGFEVNPPANNWAYTTTIIGSVSPGSGTGFSTGKSGSGDRPAGNNLFAEGERGYRIQGGDDPAQITSGVEFSFAEVDVSSRTSIDFSFKVAGFSLGGSANGIDCNSPSSGQECVPDPDKADFVLVEISPDGGATWYQQAKVISGEMNLPWSFGSDGTKSGSRIYSANNDLTYFTSTSASQYSAITIQNLPAVSQLKVRLTAQDNAINESWIIDDVKISSTGSLPKVWDGSNWTPSAPQPYDKAVINADYHTASHGSFTACQCEIKSSATITIAENTSVQVTDFMKNDGKIVVMPNGNFVQLVETDSNTGTGSLKAIQKIIVGNHQQYNYLISPTLDTNMKGVYRDSDGNPVNIPYVLYHDEKNNKFYTSSGAYIKGRALAVKEPATASAVTAEFEGKPTNGTFSYPLVNSNPTNVNRGYNLIGNPYPSNMDLVKFYQNNASSGNLSPTFYLWDNNANTRTVQEGDLYQGQAYAQFNAATPPGIGTSTKATGDYGTSVLKTPTRYVAVGQGFMSKLINVGSMAVNHSNSTRTANHATSYFGKATDAVADRYWINMTSPNHITSNIAVVYFNGGIDGFTYEDSRSMGGADAVYSMVDGEKVSINGKSTFVNSDKVLLGSTHYLEGFYTISLDHTEGIFANGQQIYLKDYEAGVITNLSEGNYSFAANAGESTGRFEILYQPETVLATDGGLKEDLVVYRDSNDFVLKSSKNVIKTVEVYEASGRMIGQLQPNAPKVVIGGADWPNGVYVLKVALKDRTVSKKIQK